MQFGRSAEGNPADRLGDGAAAAAGACVCDGVGVEPEAAGEGSDAGCAVLAEAP